MGYSYEDVTPSLIPNTTMQKRLLNGTHRSYIITPIDGYVLHDKTGDFFEIDPDTQEEIWKLAFSPSFSTCGANYDFTTRIVTDGEGNTYTGYGDREFFAVPRDSVPENQIFGATTTPETV